MSSKVELWNFFKSSISFRLVWWASRRSQFCCNNCSRRSCSSRRWSFFCLSAMKFFLLRLDHSIFSNLFGHNRPGIRVFESPLNSQRRFALLKARTQHAAQGGDDKAWSSQEWKSDVLMDDRTVKPIVCPERGAQQFVIEDDETELELSLGSRSFLDRVNDEMRKRQKTIFNECYRRQWKTFCVVVNVHVFNIGIICIHGKELLRQLAFHQEHKKSHTETNVQHIFKIGVQTRWDHWSEHKLTGKTFHGSTCLWLVMNKPSIFNTKIYIFSDSGLCLTKMNENPRSNKAWEQRLEWLKSSP